MRVWDAYGMYAAMGGLMLKIDHNIQNNQKFNLPFDTKFCGRKFYIKETKNCHYKNSSFRYN